MARYPIDNSTKQTIVQADKCFYAGQRPMAINLYSQALEREPDCVYALVQRGQALQEERHLPEAIKDYDRAISLDPEYGPAYYGRGWARHWQEDYAGELDDARRGLELDPKNCAMYLRRMGAALYGLGKYKEALEAYAQVLAQVPNDEGTLLNRAHCYADMQQYELALQDLNRALELDPDWAWAFHLRGVVYEQMGKFDKALRDYDQAIHFDPKYAPSAQGRERVLKKRGPRGLAGTLKNFFGKNS